MTDQEIARALESMIREEAQRPSEQIRDLIAAGVIDEHGRVLVGSWNKTGQDQKDIVPNPNEEPESQGRPRVMGAKLAYRLMPIVHHGRREQSLEGLAFERVLE